MYMGKITSPRFIEIWLSRSGERPLQISFTLEPQSRKANMSFLTKRTLRLSQRLDVVFAQSPRWQRLYITLLPGAPLGLLDRLGADAFPRLDTILINHPIGAWTHDVSPLDRIFQSCSRLRRVFCLGIRSSAILLNVPSHQLRAMASDAHLSVNQCLSLLSRSPKLELVFFWISSSAGASSSQTSLTMEALGVLSVITIIPPMDLFSYVILPALTSLTINCGRMQAWPLAKFILFITPFSFLLQTLRLISPPMSEPDLEACLALCPSLKELVLMDRLKAGIIGSRLVTSLINRGTDDSGGPLCPKLRKIDLSLHSCKDELLADMVVSRWQTQSPTPTAGLDIPALLVSSGQVFFTLPEYVCTY